MPPRRFHFSPLPLLLIGLALCGMGCRANKPPVKHELLKRPAIDLSHGGGGFPLDADKPPATSRDLLLAVYNAYKLRLEAPANIHIAADTVEGITGPFAPLKRLNIDLTGSTVRGDYVPKDGLKKDARAVGTVQVSELHYAADPLKYQNYSAGMRMTARNAELEMSPTNDGKLALSLTDCHDGHARLVVALDSLRQSLQEGVKIKRSLAFMVDSVDLNLTSDNPRSIAADLLVHSRVLLVPATFRLTGRADIDSEFHVHFSKLDATGLDPTGKVIAGLVQSRLDKVNNRAAQLLKLPGDKIKVSGFEIHLDQRLAVDVTFAGTK